METLRLTGISNGSHILRKGYRDLFAQLDFSPVDSCPFSREHGIVIFSSKDLCRSTPIAFPVVVHMAYLLAYLYSIPTAFSLSFFIITFCTVLRKQSNSDTGLICLIEVNCRFLVKNIKGVKSIWRVSTLES